MPNNSKPVKRYAGVIAVRLVKEREIPSATIETPEDVAKYCRPLYKGFPVEVFSVLLLNAAHGVIHWTIVSTGILNSTLVHPREVFLPAILATAAAVILIHNHPSGNVEPSEEDIQITAQLTSAGKICGIPIHDHVILAGKSFSSLARKGLI